MERGYSLPIRLNGLELKETSVLLRQIWVAPLKRVGLTPIARSRLVHEVAARTMLSRVS